MPISTHKYTRKSFVDIGGGKPTLADENNDDQRDKWVDERREGKGMVKADDLQVLQLSCSIRRQGVKSRQAAADGSTLSSQPPGRGHLDNQTPTCTAYWCLAVS